jgi:hypothetical protein
LFTQAMMLAAFAQAIGIPSHTRIGSSKLTAGKAGDAQPMITFALGQASPGRKAS